MANASSASRTCSERWSRSEYTATVRIPMSWHVRMTRTAISPRLAMRILENGAGLAGTRFGHVRCYGEVDSTNRVAADLVRRGAGEGLVVAADHQTAGRGRRGRRWETPPGSSLLVSIALGAPSPAHVHVVTGAV